MADTNQCIYFAGFFDGEGSLGIYPRKYVVSLTNTDVRPLQLAQELWGGTISYIKRDKKLDNIQDIFRWQIYGHNSIQFLNDIQDFTMVKKDQINTYLEAMKYVPKLGYKRQLESTQIIKDASMQLKLMKRGNS